MTALQPSLASENIGNYYIGRGICSIKLEAESNFHDCGNVTSFEFTVKPTLLPHYSSRIGVRKKDFVAVTELEATITLSMEEFTARNVAFALLGSITNSPDISIDILSTPIVRGALRFVGTNVIGPVWTANFPLVQFSPAKALSMISAGSGSWGSIDLQGDVLFDSVTGSFGKLTATDFNTSPPGSG